MSRDYVKSSQDDHLMPGVVFSRMMEAVHKKNVPFRLVAPGLSMSPFIRDGAIITTKSITEKLHTGDVVAFTNPYSGKLIVHRIVHISSDGYLIKGDNNPCDDGLIPISSIIGRVVKIEYKGRDQHVGLGIERFFVAWLSKQNLLRPLVRRVWLVWCALKPFIGKNRMFK